MMFLQFGTNLLYMYVCSVAVEYTTYKPCCQVNYEKILNLRPSRRKKAPGTMRKCRGAFRTKRGDAEALRLGEVVI